MSKYNVSTSRFKDETDEGLDYVTARRYRAARDNLEINPSLLPISEKVNNTVLAPEIKEALAERERRTANASPAEKARRAKMLADELRKQLGSGGED